VLHTETGHAWCISGTLHSIVGPELQGIVENYTPIFTFLIRYYNKFLLFILQFGVDFIQVLLYYYFYFTQNGEQAANWCFHNTSP